jgi:hypothetical protein
MGWMSEDENPDYKATSWNEREDDYSSVAFWYQTGTPTFAERAPGADERRLPGLARIEVGGGEGPEFPFEVAAKEPLRLEIAAALSPNGGLFQAYLDGVKIGRPMDLYEAERGSAVFPLLDFWPEPGRHVLRLERLGKNAASSGFACRIEAVRLLERRPRVAEYGHDKDKDWRKTPILYY